MTKQQVKEREDAREALRALLKPGDTLHTILRHVSRSGMSRLIDVYFLDNEGGRHWLSSRVAKATGFTFDYKREALRVGGCGMDMGFHVVYELSAALWPQGFNCIGERCPSNDHSNRENNAHHKDGGYALRQEWL